MSHRTMSGALYGSRRMMLVALPVFTKAVTPSEGHQIGQAQFTLRKAVGCHQSPLYFPWALA